MWEAYASEPASQLPAEIASELARAKLGAVLHYSRRSAETLVELACAAGFSEQLRGLLHACLSAQVAEGLAELGRFRIRIATAPTEDALLAALAPSGQDDDAGRAGSRRARRGC